MTELQMVDCPKFRARLPLKTCIERRTMKRKPHKGDSFHAAAREACMDCDLGQQRVEAAK